MSNFLKKIRRWALNKPDIKALLLIGSQARKIVPADKWSDYDLNMFVDNPDDYLSSDSWLESLGKSMLTFVERIPIDGSLEKRVLFADGQDVDFIIEATGTLDNLNIKSHPVILSILKRGYQILVDKVGISASLAEIQAIPPFAPNQPPSLNAFLNVVNDFWYHCVWIIKKLMRGELWMAKHCLNSYLQKNCLLKMIEWHTHAEKGQDIDTWFNGRFLERWARPKILKQLKKIDARHDKAEIIRTLQAVMEFFLCLSKETAALLQFAYPEEGAIWTKNWVNKTVG
jgi:aminoglycoside 6-adenylyltransferase